MREILPRLPFNETLFKKVVSETTPQPPPELIEQAREWLTREYQGIPPRRSLSREDHPPMDDPREMKVINDIVSEYLLQWDDTEG